MGHTFKFSRIFLFRRVWATASTLCLLPVSTGPQPQERARDAKDSAPRFNTLRRGLLRLPEVPWPVGRWSGRGEALLPEAPGRLGGVAAATLKRNVEVSLSREEGRWRVLGQSVWSRANAGTGRLESLPGVSTLFPPSLFVSLGLRLSMGQSGDHSLGLRWSPPACGPVSGGGAPLVLVSGPARQRLASRLF